MPARSSQPTGVRSLMRSPRLPLLFAAALVSCGQSLDGAGATADPDAAILGKNAGVMVVESFGSDAAIESILPGTHRRVRTEGILLDTDMQLRKLVDPSGRERIFTLHATQGVVVERERDGRTVVRHEIYDKARGPASANPLDAAFDASGNLWVTRHGDKSLVIIDAKGGQSFVDLAAFADDDGYPDMSAIAIVDGVAYVALRRLEGGFGTRKHASQIVAIDVATRTPSKLLDLPVKDPGARFVQRGGALWLSCIGGPRGDLLSPEPDRNAGLVRIDLAARKATVVLSAEAAGGFVTTFVLASDDIGYAIVGEFVGDNPTSVVRFDPTAGKVTATWAKTSGYFFWDLSVLTTIDGRGLLLVADRTEAAPGLRVLSSDDGARLGLIPTRLLPSQQLVLRSLD